MPCGSAVSYWTFPLSSGWFEPQTSLHCSTQCPLFLALLFCPLLGLVLERGERCRWCHFPSLDLVPSADVSRCLAVFGCQMDAAGALHPQQLCEQPEPSLEPPGHLLGATTDQGLQCHWGRLQASHECRQPRSCFSFPAWELCAGAGRALATG